jgi:hypothetical protein
MYTPYTIICSLCYFRPPLFGPTAFLDASADLHSGIKTIWGKFVKLKRLIDLSVALFRSYSFPNFKSIEYKFAKCSQMKAEGKHKQTIDRNCFAFVVHGVCGHSS